MILFARTLNGRFPLRGSRRGNPAWDGMVHQTVPCRGHEPVKRRWEGNRLAAQEYVEDMRDVLREAAQVCKDLDDEALAKESRLACGTECAAAIADLAARWNVPFERT